MTHCTGNNSFWQFGQSSFCYVLTVTLALVLAGCVAGTPPASVSDQHIQKKDFDQRANIPPPVDYTLPFGATAPTPTERTKTFSVVVKDLPVRDLLFALGRDAKMNVDVHTGIEGTITMNAIDQTLPELLDRISRQADVRFETDGGTLSARPDSPYLVHYRVNYVNATRTSKSTISATSQVTSPVGGGSGGGASSVTIEDVSNNEFWKSLEKNISDILHETDKIIPANSQDLQAMQAQSNANEQSPVALPLFPTKSDSQDDTSGSPLTDGAKLSAKDKQIILKGAQSAVKDVVSGSLTTLGLQARANRSFTYREAASVIVNRETGIVSVRATSRQHERVKNFIDLVQQSARRLVSIEATIVQVTLSNNYQQGIDWQRLRSNNTGFGLINTPSLGTALNSQIPFTFQWRQNNTGDGLSTRVAVSLLEQFGNVKVLSSPKLSVLNNQTALLKVVDNVVYFTASADTVTNLNQTVTNITTTPQTVAVGLVMSVTAQISESDEVILNVRPSISKITSFVTDPNPNLQTTPSRVPEISTQEMESVLRVPSSNTVVLGGLIGNNVDLSTSRIPILGRIPLFGELFNYRNNSVAKTELVIFIRPTVVHDASLEGDYRNYKTLVPETNFLDKVDPETRYDKIAK